MVAPLLSSIHMDLDESEAFTQPSSLYYLPDNDHHNTMSGTMPYDVEIDSGLKKRRRRDLNRADWELQRERITDLYLNERMKLEDVMQEMRDRYGFIAERHMYLRRIKKWSLNKNYKFQEKQVIAEDLASHHPDHASSPNTYLINNRPAQMHRVRRHIKNQKKPATTVSRTNSFNIAIIERASGRTVLHTTSQAGPKPRNPKSSQELFVAKLNQSYTRKTVLNGAFIFGPANRTAEVFLIKIQEYTQVRLRALSKSSNMEEIEDADAQGEPREQRQFFDRLNSAADVFRANSPSSFRHELEEACALVKVVLQTAHWRLIVGLFSGLAHLWRADEAVARQILRFMRDMASVVYGAAHAHTQHCLVHLLDLWLTMDNFSQVVEAAGQVILRAATSVSTEDSKFAARVRSYLNLIYESWNLEAAAERVAQQNYELCLSRYGRQSWHTRRAASHLAHGYYKSKRFLQARDVLEPSVNGFYQSDARPDPVSADASALLADTCLALGLFEKSLHYYTLSNLWYEMMEQGVTTFWYDYNCRMMQLLWQRQGVVFEARKLQPLEGVASADAEAYYRYCCSLQYGAEKDKDCIQYLYT